MPILATKLYLPPPRLDAVARPRLIARLNEGLHCPLTLIAAPAGFGKTTLVSEWIAGSGRAAAWLSLDAGDNDPARFLTYFVAALQTIAPQIGAGVVGALQSPQPPPTASLLTALLNEIAVLPDDLLLVLDDYHAIEATPVDDALAFLLDHLPPRMHLVIATREDPPLPLARLRARGQLTELRATDLRFTPDEAAAFLNSAMGLRLSAEEITALEERTEGWIAGLQLAALSLRGRQDVSGLIRAFAGDHRYIMDYLVEEVLQRQPESVRSFLLHTAILERLSGPLCDAVTSQEGGDARLASLERGNFFVVPLDDTRHWYRYHHLFAAVLHAHLLAEQPAQVPALHRHASAWYAQHGSAADAIRHALAGGDFDRAADLIELAVPAMRQSRQETVALGWLKALPNEVIAVRPVLSAAYASMLLVSGQLEGVEARLLDAERWLDITIDRSAMVVVDDEEYRRLPGSIAVWRAGQALTRGDVANTMVFARQALDLAPENDHLRRGSAAALVGLASWASGDLETGYRMYAEGMAHVQRAGHLSDVLGCTIALADIRLAQGRLREAMRSYERALALAAEQGDPALRGTADIYVGMSGLAHEHNDLDAATQLLLRSKALGVLAGLPQNPYRWCVAMARVREVEGDRDGALALLDEAERLYVGDFFPDVRPVAAMRARVWAAQGRVGEALDWAHVRGLSAHDDLSYLRECEHITLARVLIAEYERDHADRAMRETMGLLERLRHAAEAGRRTGSVIEILVLQALAHRAHGEHPAALVPLQRALTLAEPEGYVRLFVGEGPPMAHLLQSVAKRGVAPGYVRQLLAAFGPTEERTPVKQAVIEPLSDRERDVLRLLRGDLNGPDIARQLMVSLNTLRTHTQNIYSKLGVSTRRAAVRRAEELDLF